MLCYVTDRLLIMYGILPRQLFFVAAVVYSWPWAMGHGTAELWISPVYRRLAVAKFFKVHNVEIVHVTMTTPT